MQQQNIGLYIDIRIILLSNISICPKNRVSVGLYFIL